MYSDLIDIERPTGVGQACINDMMCSSVFRGELDNVWVDKCLETCSESKLCAQRRVLCAIPTPPNHQIAALLSLRYGPLWTTSKMTDSNLDYYLSPHN